MRIPIQTEDNHHRGLDNMHEEDFEKEYEDREHDEEKVSAGEERYETGDESAEEWKHRCMCMKADFENYKRNVEAERARLAEVGKESVLTELFPIAEHLERAVQAATGRKRDNRIVEGIELVQKDLNKIFDKHGIERIPTVGECFDPEVHEAVAAVESEDACEGEILEEIQAGFKRNGRLIRPAKVVVAKY
jgi:molecular chaperone GrpE